MINAIHDRFDLEAKDNESDMDDDSSEVEMDMDLGISMEESLKWNPI